MDVIVTTSSTVQPDFSPADPRVRSEYTSKILAFFFNYTQELIRVNVALQLLLSADACIIMPHKPSFLLSD